MRSRYEIVFVSALCLLGAARVVLFSAAFPFFNNVDEQVHLDLVVKYALGRTPRSFEPMAPEAAALVANYGSPEFLLTPQRARENGFVEPLWKHPELEQTIADLAEQFQSHPNFESSQPPLYYILAGFWFDLGQAVGLLGEQLLYWVRFFNALLIAALVWLAFLAARGTSNDPNLYLSVPLLVAFSPQDAFYSIENDNLSPVIGGAAFLLLLLWLSDKRIPFLVSALTGLTVAAAYLTKLANLPFVGLVLAVILLNPVFKRRRIAPALICLLTALLPIFLWMWWCKNQFGDLTGTSGKVASLTWTHKPIRQWWSHPIFTAGGTWIFLSELLARFWRGEFTWHGQVLAWRPADAFYAVSSLVFPMLALTDLRGSALGPAWQKRALLLCAVLFLASIVFLGLLSIQFDFGRCPYPSQNFPYFTSGRLMMVAFVPFGILYVHGIARALHWLRAPVSPFIVVGIIVLFVTGTEIVLSREVFGSVYNWFHS
jgi:hypothetical protein